MEIGLTGFGFYEQSKGRCNNRTQYGHVGSTCNNEPRVALWVGIMNSEEFKQWVKETTEIVRTMKCPKCGGKLNGYTDKTDESEWIVCTSCGWASNFRI